MPDTTNVVNKCMGKLNKKQRTRRDLLKTKSLTKKSTLRDVIKKNIIGIPFFVSHVQL